VAAYDLFVTGEHDSSELPPDPHSQSAVFELQFDRAVADDNARVEGGFRRAGGRWSRFVFVKAPQPRPEYQLHMPVFGQQTGAGSLLYHVPQADRLDRRYVLPALAEIVCVQDWQESGPLMLRGDGSGTDTPLSSASRHERRLLAALTRGGAGGPLYPTFVHAPLFALSSTASQIFCVSSASRKVGPAGLPVARPSRKSATWWTKPLS
jgi:hypothetical protein